MNEQGDTVVILSSELIAEITEQYFNKTMFKRNVKIVDLKPTENGYMFTIAFVEKAKQTVEMPTWKAEQLAKDAVNGVLQRAARDRKGQFAKVTE